jgi:hypothetical protein
MYQVNNVVCGLLNSILPSVAGEFEITAGDAIREADYGALYARYTRLIDISTPYCYILHKYF